MLTLLQPSSSPTSQIVMENLICWKCFRSGLRSRKYSYQGEGIDEAEDSGL